MNLSKTKAVIAFFLGVSTVMIFSLSCSKKSSSAPPATMTLYDSLGGSAMVSDPANSGTMVEKGYLGIRTIVDSAVFIIAADARINGYFQVLIGEVTSGNTSGYQKLSTNFSNFVAVATGAKDYTYTGLSMPAAHDPSQNPRISMKVDSADFTAFVVDVAASATKNGLPSYLLARVGTVLSSVEGQVVQR
jgi:hypothetical protein